MHSNIFCNTSKFKQNGKIVANICNGKPNEDFSVASSDTGTIARLQKTMPSHCHIAYHLQNQLPVVPLTCTLGLSSKLVEGGKGGHNS